MSMEALFRNNQTLPNVPRVVHELIASFGRDDVAVSEIATGVQADQVLSAKLLRAANCAHYGVSRRIGSVDEAVMLLGFNNIRAIVIGSGLAGSAKPAPGLDLTAFWHYSVRTAAAARWLASRTGEDGGIAFTLGMMHAIGQLVMHAAMPERMQLVDRVSGAFSLERPAVERREFGFDFHAVGAELASRWQFPEQLVAALRLAEAPGGDRMAAVVCLAVWAARCDALALAADARAAALPAEAVAALGIDPSLPLEDLPPLAELAADMESLIG